MFDELEEPRIDGDCMGQYCSNSEDCNNCLHIVECEDYTEFKKTYKEEE